MIIGSLIFQRFLSDDPDYLQTFDMFYWMVFTSVVFLVNGVIKLK
jgi:hypothetical protein